MNFYKPRLKLVLKLNSKINPYKNSRLWKFNDIRGRKYLRKGYWHRQYLKLKNLKWISKRRFLRSQKKWKKSNKNFKFNNAIIQRKSFLLFYGKNDFTNFKRILFLNYKKSRLNKLNSFLKAFEFRISTVLFRMKFFPTIFASHFFIKTNGVFINGNKTDNTSLVVKVGDIISVPKKYWFFFLYIFEYKIYKRLSRLISLFNRKKKMYKKYYLLSYLNKRRFLNKKKLTLLTNLNYKKEAKLINVLNQNKYILDSNNSFLLKKKVNIYKFNKNKQLDLLKSKLNIKKLYKTQRYFVNFYNYKNIKKSEKFFNKKKSNNKHVPKILKKFLNNKQEKNSYFKKISDQRLTKINKINLNLKFDNFIFIKYQNIKEKLIKIKLLNRLVKIQNKLNYFYKLVKLLNNKNLNFLWLFLYIKYKQIKFNILEDKKTSKKLIIFKSIIKKFMIKNINLTKVNNTLKQKTILSLYSLFFDKIIKNKQINNYKISNLYSNNFIFNIFTNLNYKKSNKISNFKDDFILTHNKNINNIFEIKKKIIFLNLFFKIFIFNLKILINNFYIKFFSNLLNLNSQKINNIFLTKFKISNNLNKRLYILKLIENYQNLNKSLYKDIKYSLKENKKFFVFFKNLTKKYSENLLMSNYFYKKRFFIWFKLNKKLLKNKTRQRHSLNRLKKIKKKLLNKTRWRFLKKNKFERPFNEYWFIPSYIELDLKTLRGGVIKDPTYNDINYSFNLSIKNILNYYKDLGF